MNVKYSSKFSSLFFFFLDFLIFFGGSSSSDSLESAISASLRFAPEGEGMVDMPKAFIDSVNPAI